MEQQQVSGGPKWESAVGYSRAVRRGAHVFVSGTTATDAEGNVVGVGNPGQQMRQALSNIKSALHEVGASLDDVVRTRIYVIDIDQWQVIGRVHGEVFGDVRPATSMVEVRRLIDPDMLVEIEAVALAEEE